MDKERLAAVNRLCSEERWEEAIAQFEVLLGQYPHWPEARYSRAKAYFKMGQLKASIADFDFIIALDTQNAHWLSERAVAYLLKGDPQRAIQDLDLAAALEPENPYRYSSRAFVKDRAGDYKGAIADYEKAIALDPEDAIAYNNKGLVEEKIGWKAQAQKSFSLADAKDPKKITKSESASTKPYTQTQLPEGYVDAQAKEEVPSQAAAPKHGLNDYLGVIKDTFSIGQGWAEFFSFLGKKLKGKN